MLHHVDRTLVDRVVCFVSQPVLITLTERHRGVNEVAVHFSANKTKQGEKPVVLTCLMAVTVMTKKSGSPLVIGLVGVSMIN